MFLTEAGEDKIVTWKSCNYSTNMEVATNLLERKVKLNCKNGKFISNLLRGDISINLNESDMNDIHDVKFSAEDLGELINLIENCILSSAW